MADTVTARSRRALIGAALGGVGAWAASALVRPSGVAAGSSYLVLGSNTNQATALTKLINTDSQEPTLEAGSSSGVGLTGSSFSSHGVDGTSTQGVGVYASAGVAGFALETSGRLRFGTSGLATISGGSTSNVLDPGVDVTATSFVLLTPMANIGSRNLWFTRDTAANTITIRISSPRPSPTRVSWLLLG